MSQEELLSRVRALHAEGVSRSKAAKALGLPIWKLDVCIESMGLEWKRNIRGGSIEIEGVVDSWAGHSKRLGLPVGALRWRLNHGCDMTARPVEAISEQDARAFTDLRKQGVPAWEAAERVGRPYANLRVAALKHCLDYQQAVNDAPRIRRSKRSTPQSSAA